ncbi:MAG TPA: VOC family protein [Candidatus Dormibacteraeota bacterium]|jgi:predicted enzyme related to lactoylglutathione lyase|nr:VOC family protein [Candidatus Dormibacteraeota bacterium]
MGNPVTHFEIVGQDAGALQAFYRDAFGWEVRPAGPTYAMVLPGADAGINGGVGAAPEGGGASRVTVYVEVEDLDRALSRIQSLGGGTVVGPLAVPNGPRIALFRDPEGHVVGLTESATIRR